MRPVGSTLTRPRVGEPAGPGRHEAAVQRVQHVGDLVGGPRQPRHDLAGGELQDGDDVRARSRPSTSAATAAAFAGVPARRRPSPRRAAGRASRRGRRRPTPSARARPPARQREQLGRHRRRRPRLGQQLRLVQPERAGDRRPQPRQRARRPAPHLRGAQHGEHEVHPRLAHRRAAEDVQAVADLHVLDLAQVAVDVQHEVVELGLVRLLVDVQVVVQLRGPDQRPDLRAQRRQLRRVERLRRSRTRRAAAPAWPGRRTCRPAPSAAPGGRRRWRARAAWPACPRPGR